MGKTIRIPKTYRPSGSRMLCQQILDVESLHIIVPESVKNKSLLFQVLSKGPGCVDDSVKEGDFVYTGQFAPCHIGFPNHRDWHSINEEDVLGVVTEFDEKEAE